MFLTRAVGGDSKRTEQQQHSQNSYIILRHCKLQLANIPKLEIFSEKSLYLRVDPQVNWELYWCL